MNNNWSLYHSCSGHIEYFATEEEAEARRMLFFKEWDGDYDGEEQLISNDWDYFCDYWIIDKIKSPDD